MLEYNKASIGLRTLSIALFFSLWAISDADAQRRPSRPSIPGTVSNVEWNEDGNSVVYTSEGTRYRLDLRTLEKTEIEPEVPSEEPETEAPRTTRRRRPVDQSNALNGKYVGRPTRGRQYSEVISPDEKWAAKYEDWNVVLVHQEDEQRVPVTRDGNEHVHYGTASWVYGEELNQIRAMWWTPDSKKLVFYKFDDSNVEPFYLVRGWTEIGTSLYPEYYPKAGATNPVSNLMIYDLESKKTIPVDIGGSSDEYIYKIRCSPDGSVMMLNWTDRLQRHLKVMELNTDSGECRLIVEEKQECFQENYPSMRFLEDHERFLWQTQKNGFTHYELRDLDGKLHNKVTSAEFETGGVAFVDEEKGLVGFTAYSSEANPYYLQYHMVGLDGQDSRRVTTTDMHHSNFSLSPDKTWLVAQYESVNTPPCTALYKTDGTLATHLAESDPASASNLAEMFKFRSNDDAFDIYGILYKPSDFDDSKSYPVINPLYAGPDTNEFEPSYVSTQRAECGRGYLVVKVNNRGTGRRGKEFLSSAYGKLGDVDIQDHADAIRLLRDRPYFDGNRVGIVGHSYGGYMAMLGILKHPDVYAASVVRAGVSDWRNYDTIYTERYMSTPQLNPEGYDAGSAMQYAKQLKGKLIIMHGMMDDNVHPNNAFQLIEALNNEKKLYETHFWPNAGHGLGTGINEIQNDFFDRVLKPSSTSDL